MSENIMASPKQMQDTAEALSGLAESYKKAIEELTTCEQQLRSRWEGASNQAFQQAFNNDKVSLDQFYTVVSKYVQSLQTAASNYDTAEKNAVVIAGQKG